MRGHPMKRYRCSWSIVLDLARRALVGLGRLTSSGPATNSEVNCIGRPLREDFDAYYKPDAAQG
jgi:hypothetical protein